LSNAERQGLKYAAARGAHCKGLPLWPAFDPAKRRVMELGDHFGPIPIASSPARFEFWQRFFATRTAW
jgi:para-nitrobenzyl esterase